MNPTNDTSVILPTGSRRKRHVNWHEAAACAMEIELRDYADLLRFLSEYVLGKNSYRIDLLIIKKLSGQMIPKNIARIFKTCNLFECKGIHSSVTISAYYKTIGYAGLLTDQMSTIEARQYSPLDISISFVTFRYPRKLLKHLTKERHLTIEKSSEGIYHIITETFSTQIIIANRLPPDENLYLYCLANGLRDTALTNRLANDYAKHQGEDIYTKYLNQLTTAYNTMKGESVMVCEGLLNLFGTSSAEIIANAKKESEAQINELSEANKQLSTSNKLLSSQNDRLKELLRQNNISFE